MELVELFFMIFVIPCGALFLIGVGFVWVVDTLFGNILASKEKKVKKKTVRTESRRVSGVVTSKVIKRTSYGHDYKISVRLETGNVVSFKGEYDYNKATEGESVTVNYVTHYDKNDRILEDNCFLFAN